MEGLLIIVITLSLMATHCSDDEAIMAFGALVGCIAFAIFVILGCKNMGLL